MTTLNEFKQALADGTLTGELLEALRSDSRAGARQILARYERAQQKLADERLDRVYRSRYERELWPRYDAIAGIDEVGRGPLAGPVITAAVVLPQDFDLPVNDSKQLTDKKRRELYPKILHEARAVSIGVADNHMIDRENIYHATELAMAKAVNDLSVRPNYLLVDAMHVPVDIPQTKLIKGDANSISIASASIVAKVIRDRLMAMYDQVYPGYDFANNAGYGTKAHLAGLDELGITAIHRISFDPVRRAGERHGQL